MVAMVCSQITTPPNNKPSLSLHHHHQSKLRSCSIFPGHEMKPPIHHPLLLHIIIEEARVASFGESLSRASFLALLSASLFFVVDPSLAFKGGGGGPYGSEVTRAQDLTGKSLIRQDFKTFKGANLVGASFFDAELTGADMSDADLRGADFSLANVTKVNLTNANLEGALVTGNTSFNGSIITGADFTDVLFRDDQKEYLYKVADGEKKTKTNKMVANLNSKSQISFAGTFASSAFAACFAEICTIPLDTAKVRLQLQKKAAGGDGVSLPKYKGMLGTVATIAREEGMASLWKGIIPGLHRQCIYGGLRIALYEPVKSFYVGADFVGDVPLFMKILAALTTGALAIAVANPTDLVKVRLQSEGKLPAGVPRRYSGALNAYSTIVRQEGVGALWTGIGPNIARNAIINAAELASYDQVKQTILNIPGFKDDVFTQLLAGLGAGFFAVCIGSPVDVVKSRMMGGSTYKSTLDCFIRTLKNDGPLAFYKGFIPNFGRLGSWNVIMFLTFEQVKKLFTREV